MLNVTTYLYKDLIRDNTNCDKCAYQAENVYHLFKCPYYSHLRNTF